jgi:mono/diheme cytochrome c family protein
VPGNGCFQEVTMKSSRLLVVGAAVLGLVGWAGTANADAAAGKAKFADVCSECHEVADYEGEDAKSLTESMKKIVAGQTKHKKALKLTDAEIADLAAYMSAGK